MCTGRSGLLRVNSIILGGDSMSIKVKANAAIQDLENLLAEKWTDSQEQSARKIIETAMLDAINEMCKHSAKAVNLCCSADQDMAHKINEELQRTKYAVLANLNSMR